jgi:hypothetical protein
MRIKRSTFKSFPSLNALYSDSAMQFILPLATFTKTYNNIVSASKFIKIVYFTQVQQSKFKLAIEEAHNSGLDSTAADDFVLLKNHIQMGIAPHSEHPDKGCFVLAFYPKSNV